MWRGLLCACLGTAWMTSAFAGDSLRNDWSGEYAPKRSLSITVAPLSLMHGMWSMRGPGGGVSELDLTAELRVGESRSIAITKSIAMAPKKPITWSGGQGSTERTTPSRGVEMNLGKIGLQLRDYVVGTFDNGLFLGGQVQFTNPDLFRFRADETSFGPMGGMKVSLSIFTVEGRAGAWLGMGKNGLSVEPRVDLATGFTF